MAVAGAGWPASLDHEVGDYAVGEVAVALIPGGMLRIMPGMKWLLWLFRETEGDELGIVRWMRWWLY